MGVIYNRDNGHCSHVADDNRLPEARPSKCPNGYHNCRLSESGSEDGSLCEECQDELEDM